LFPTVSLDLVSLTVALILFVWNPTSHTKRNSILYSFHLTLRVSRLVHVWNITKKMSSQINLISRYYRVLMMVYNTQRYWVHPDDGQGPKTQYLCVIW
jgi:SPX domain protein involved in polyphosphate accumulation